MNTDGLPLLGKSLQWPRSLWFLIICWTVLRGLPKDLAISSSGIHAAAIRTMASRSSGVELGFPVCFGMIG